MLPSLPAREDRLAFLHHYAEASGKRREILATKSADWWNEETMNLRAAVLRWLIMSDMDNGNAPWR